MALSGSAKSSQLSGALAAGLGGLALAAFFRKLDRVDGVAIQSANSAVSAMEGWVRDSLCGFRIVEPPAGYDPKCLLDGLASDLGSDQPKQCAFNEDVAINTVSIDENGEVIGGSPSGPASCPTVP